LAYLSRWSGLASIVKACSKSSVNM
jgi:hypothetical protein